MVRVAVGREVRAFRQKLGIKVADLAAAIKVSPGMLSKIENGTMSPSLTALQALSRTLGVPITVFLRRFEEEHEAIFTQAGDVERRSASAKHQTRLFGHIRSKDSGAVVEPYLIVINKKPDDLLVLKGRGMGFVYLLQGEMVYCNGEKYYKMSVGDSLLFDASAPHGPKELRELPICYLLIISHLRATIRTTTEVWRRK